MSANLQHAGEQHGLIGFPEIGLRLGISQERARQIYHRAMWKLRRKRSLRDLYDELKAFERGEINAIRTKIVLRRQDFRSRITGHGSLA